MWSVARIFCAKDFDVSSYDSYTVTVVEMLRVVCHTFEVILSRLEVA